MATSIRSFMGIATGSRQPKGRIRPMGSGHEFQSLTKTILVMGTNPLPVNNT
jgi:hypothetical protein